MNHVKEILAGLAVFVVVGGAVLGGGAALYSSGQGNREKVERMTELCLSRGHTGWNDYIGCFGGTVEQ